MDIVFRNLYFYIQMHPDIQALLAHNTEGSDVWIPMELSVTSQMPPEMVKMFVFRNLTNMLPSLAEQVEQGNHDYIRDLLDIPVWDIARKALLDWLVQNDVPVWNYSVTEDERHRAINESIGYVFLRNNDDKSLILGKLRDLPITQETLSQALYYRCPVHVIAWLLEQGLDIQYDDKSIGTPLMWACRPGFRQQEPDLDVIRFLLDHSADPRVVCRGTTAMSLCEDTPGGHAAIELLCVCPEQLNAELCACLRGGRRFREFSPSRIRLLVRLGADINLNMETSPDEHITPLMFACHNGRTALIRLLLELGADKTMRAVKDDKDSRAFTFYLNFLTRARRTDWDTLKQLDENG